MSDKFGDWFEEENELKDGIKLFIGRKRRSLVIAAELPKNGGVLELAHEKFGGFAREKFACEQAAREKLVLLVEIGWVEELPATA